MLIKKVEFIRSFSSIEKLPSTNLPEFAFIGRSNVGKSSLMNMLLGRKNLVKTSKKPGTTILLNYFLINNSFYLVDLPGYGFALRAKSEQKVWQTLIEGYLKSRREVAALFLLIDSRHGKMPNDEQMIEFLACYNIAFSLVFTKVDKLNKTQLSLTMQKNQNSFFASAVTGFGQAELLDYIEQKLKEKNGK